MKEIKQCPFCGCGDRRVGIRKMGNNGCGTVCMTTKLPFDDWHECPTCRQMIYLHNVRRKTIRIADDGQVWLEMLKEATEE